MTTVARRHSLTLVAFCWCGTNALQASPSALSQRIVPKHAGPGSKVSGKAISDRSLERLSDGYSSLVKTHYLPMAFFQAGVLASGADIATQLMEHGTSTPSLVDRFVVPILQSLHLVATPDPVVVAHVLAMATVASTMSGAANAVWLRQLEDAFPGKETKEVVSKTLIHAVILASIINSACEWSEHTLSVPPTASSHKPADRVVACACSHADLVGVPLFTNLYSGGSLPPFSNPGGYLSGWTLDEFVTLTSKRGLTSSSRCELSTRLQHSTHLHALYSPFSPPPPFYHAHRARDLYVYPVQYTRLQIRPSACPPSDACNGVQGDASPLNAALLTSHVPLC